MLLRNKEGMAVEAIVVWCNNNPGFCSAALSLLSLFNGIVAICISLYAVKRPYEKRVSYNFYISYSDDGRYVANVSLANIGACDLCIKIAYLTKKSDGEWVGSLSFSQRGASSFTFCRGEICDGKAVLFPVNSAEASLFAERADDFVLIVEDYDGWGLRSQVGNGLAVG